MSRSSFGDVLPLVCGPALVLFGLEILWASSTHLALPLSPYYFVPSLFLLILAAAGFAGLTRWTDRLDRGWQHLLGGGLTAGILLFKFFLMDAFAYPIALGSLIVPVLLIMAVGAFGRRFGPHVDIAWFLAAMLALTVSTDLFKVLVVQTGDLSWGSLIRGTGVSVLTGALLVGLLAWVPRVHRRGWTFHPAFHLLVLLAVMLGWGSWIARGSHGQHPTGFENFRSSFNGTVPSAEMTGTRSVTDLPNIILISVDTLRWDQAPPVDTGLRIPNFRRLRRDSIAFTHHFSSEVWTLPSHASLFTGRLPWRHGAVDIGKTIQPEIPLFTQQLRSLGYETAGFSGGRFLKKGNGFGRGYDVYRSYPFTDRPYLDYVPGGLEYLFAMGVPTRSGVPVAFHPFPPRDPSGDEERFFHRTVRHGLRWLDDQRRHRDRPFFLFLHTYQVHDYNQFYEASLDRLTREHPELASHFRGGDTHPRFHDVVQEKWKRLWRLFQRLPVRQVRARLLGPEPADPRPMVDAAHPRDPDLRWLQQWRRYARSVLVGLWHLYRYGIESTDRSLGALIEGLRSRDLYEDSLIVFLSDHGEGFLLRSNALGHHGGQYEDTLLRIPLWIKLPGNAKAGSRSEAFLQISDVFPVLFDYLGVRTPGTPTLGVRPRPAPLFSSGTRRRKFIRASTKSRTYRPPQFVVRGREYKLMRSLEENMVDYRRVREDGLRESSVPPERVPAAARRRLRSRMDALLEDYRRSDRIYERDPQPLTPRQKRIYRGLGYLN